jgi:diphthamide synthase (EF-2-diphthine--ammonia ligase)
MLHGVMRYLGFSSSSGSKYRMDMPAMDHIRKQNETMGSDRKSQLEVINATTFVKGTGLFEIKEIWETQPHTLARTEKVVTGAVQSVVCHGALQYRVTSFCSIDFRSNGTELDASKTIKQVQKTVICNESVVSSVKKERLEKVCDQSGANPLIQADVTKEVMDRLKNLGFTDIQIQEYKNDLETIRKELVAEKAAKGTDIGNVRALNLITKAVFVAAKMCGIKGQSIVKQGITAGGAIGLARAEGQSTTIDGGWDTILNIVALTLGIWLGETIREGVPCTERVEKARLYVEHQKSNKATDNKYSYSELVKEAVKEGLRALVKTGGLMAITAGMPQIGDDGMEAHLQAFIQAVVTESLIDCIAALGMSYIYGPSGNSSTEVDNVHAALNELNEAGKAINSNNQQVQDTVENNIREQVGAIAQKATLGGVKIRSLLDAMGSSKKANIERAIRHAFRDNNYAETLTFGELQNEGQPLMEEGAVAPANQAPVGINGIAPALNVE